MRITRVDVFHLRVPLKGTFTSSQSTRTSQKSVVIEIHTDNGLTGLGNVDPSPGYSLETTEEIIACLNNSLIPAVINKDPREIVLRISDMDRAVEGKYHAKAALEMAFHDLFAKELNIPVCRLLGGPVCERVSVIPSWIGHKPSKEAAEEAVYWVSKGFSTLKIKVGENVEEDIDRVRAVRQNVGPNVELRVDANEGYTPEEAIRAINGFAPYGILYCEQPVPRDNWNGMAQIRKSVTVPLMADEGIVEPKDILIAAEKKAADIVKVKVMKHGGLYRTNRMIWLAGALGMRCVLGHGFTLGINSLSEIHLAASLPNIMMPIETTGMLKVVEDVITEPIQIDKGWVKVPTIPGLGVTLDREKLSRFQV